MVDTEIRMGEKRFFDNKAFPRGFSKSGDFTLAEDEILTLYGQTLSALELGSIEPVSTEEKHFLKVLKNPGKAKTKIEWTWLKYVKLARGRKAFYTLNGRSKHSDVYSSETEVESVESDDFAEEY